MSEILDIAHEMARDLFNVGAMDESMMLKVEELCYGNDDAGRWGKRNFVYVFTV